MTIEELNREEEDFNVALALSASLNDRKKTLKSVERSTILVSDFYISLRELNIYFKYEYVRISKVNLDRKKV